MEKDYSASIISDGYLFSKNNGGGRLLEGNFMQERKKGVLIIVPTFSPNVGGVETHLDDLVAFLAKTGFQVFVQTYAPITTIGVSWKPKERYENVFIRRYRWFGKNLLHRIEKIPLLHFLYIAPYLFFRVLIFLIMNSKKIDIIHAHGINAALIGIFLKKIFKKRLIISIHAVYEIDPGSSTAKRISKILSYADSVLTLSRASYNELISFGTDKKIMGFYRHWVNLNNFTPLNQKNELRESFNLKDKFTVLFVGRLTEIKGIRELVVVATRLSDINFVFIGEGPLSNFLKEESKKKINVIFLGKVKNKELPKYYNMADIFCIPSQYEEGFGRVAAEAVACGLPVVGSNRGGIAEALDNSVSLLMEPTIENLENAILRLCNDRQLYVSFKENCRVYAERNFSENNALGIIRSYEKNN
ncbi:MAG: glycosyltransferase family 4 protein [Candidatus Omnitrophica bacterium]|nr:glycosyltransferase family 4 protein [Candidatus Omnitrophota bacterium]